MVAATVAQFTELVLLFVLAVAVAIVSYKLRFPYTVSLVVFGVLLGLLASTTAPLKQLGAASIFSSDVFFGVMLPPLIFEAALHIDFHLIKSRARLILFLSFLGVVISTFLTGLLVSAFTAIPFVFALLLGAILSPTDPIAVTDLFRRLRVPEELATIVETESLLNDGTGIVVFVAISQMISIGQFELFTSLRVFATLVFGGLALGIVFAAAAYAIHSRIDDPLIETAVSVIAAYGSFHAALALGLSGIIATAVTGIAIGTWAVPQAMRSTTRETMLSFWQVVVYIANSLIFLSMGLLVNVLDLAGYIVLILLVLGFVTLARAAFVYVNYPVSRLLRDSQRRIPLHWYNVLTLSGVRGAVPIVLALTLAESALPIPAPVRTSIVSAVIGAALISITVQSLAASWYVKSRFRAGTDGSL